MSRSYTITALVTASIASLCIIFVTYVVDPYKLYPAVPSLSEDTSVDLFFLLRLHDAHAIERVKPSILIVGNSRAAALSPDLLGNPGDAVYNASLPGATLREVRHVIEHAQAIRPLTTVFIGLDHQMFREGSSDKMPLDELTRYRKTDPTLLDRWTFAYQRFEDYWGSLFTVSALMDVWRIQFGKGPTKADFREDGTWDLESRGKQGKPAVYFDRLIRQIYDTSVTNQSQPLVLDELTELLDYTDAHQIQTILFFLPMHALLMNTMEFADSWDQYLEWQRELVIRVDARNGNTEIYGIENRPKLILEAINAPDPLFRDGVHTTRRAGTEILACLAGPCSSGYRPARLDSQSIDAYLKQVDNLRIRFANKNPKKIKQARRHLKLDKKTKTQ